MSTVKHARWTAPEIERLVRSYPVMTADELVVAFPRHPLSSIISTANARGIRKIYGSRKWREIAARHAPLFNFGVGARRLQAAE